MARVLVPCHEQRRRTEVSELATTCGTCGTETAAGARFCRSCGAPVDARPEKGRASSDATTLPRLATPDGSSPTTPEPSPTGHDRRVVIFAIVGAVVLIAIGLGVGLLLFPHDSKSEATTPRRSAPAPASTVATTQPAPVSTTTTIPADQQQTLDLAQQWATALTTKDWTTARQVNPGMASKSDAQLDADFGGLSEDQLVIVRSTGPGVLTVASVAHEDVGAGPRTNVYCYLVIANPSQGTISATRTGPGRTTPGSVPGWVAPSELSAQIAACGS